MPNKKISQLNINTNPTPSDAFAIVNSEEKAKKLMASAELTIIEAMEPKDFLEKHNLKMIPRNGLNMNK